MRHSGEGLSNSKALINIICRLHLTEVIAKGLQLPASLHFCKKENL